MNYSVTLGPIIIGVSNLSQAKEFYTNVFGIKIEHESPHYVSAYLGKTHIELEEDSENRFPGWAEHNIGTYKNSEFIVTDMQAFVDAVCANGGSIVSDPIARPWGSTTAEIADPDGNIFLISQAGK